MADEGPSRAIIKSWFIVIVIVWGPSMAVIGSQIEVVAMGFATSTTVFDGQLKVMMIQKGPSMTIFDSQLEVMVLWLESTSKVNWMVVGMVEGVVDQRTWRLASCVSFSEAFVSSFKDTWNLRKQHVYPDMAPLMLMQHIRVISSYSDRNHWFKSLNRSSIPTIDLVFKTQSLLSIKYDPMAWI